MQRAGTPRILVTDLLRLSDPGQRSRQTELLDRPGWSDSELRANFRDIKLVNRWFGGTALSLRLIDEIIDQRIDRAAIPRQLDPGHSRARARPTIVDIGTGAADLPVALAGRNGGRSPYILAVDVSPAVVRLARTETHHSVGIAVAVGDGLQLPIPDQSVDVAHCALTLHHLRPGDAAALLAELGRICRLGFVVNDLRRCLPGYLAAWSFANGTTNNPLTRHDAPLSVLRAYTLQEAIQIAQAAGLPTSSVRAEPWFRLSIVWRRDA